ncbi:hypothetical protein CapIbe_000935 [Capra ibex]
MLSRGVSASGGDYGDPLVSSPCRGQKVIWRHRRHQTICSVELQQGFPPLRCLCLDEDSGLFSISSGQRQNCVANSPLASQQRDTQASKNPRWGRKHGSRKLWK